VTRVNAARRLQLFRFWPDKNRLDTLDATTTFVWNGARFRAFPDSRHVVYLGRPASDTAGGDQLRIFDLTTGRSRSLLRNLGLLPPGFAFSPDGKWVVLARSAGNLLEYFALAADGSGRERKLYSAIADTQWPPDIGSDGTLYITASTRLLEVHRFKPPAGRLDREIVGDGTHQIMALPDGRVLTPVVSGGKSRIMVVGGAGGDHPFVATDEENGGPMAVLGSEFVVFQILKNSHPVEIAVASIRTGRIANRFPVPDATTVAGSPDGKTIFFAKDAQIYRLQVAGGQPQHLTSGFGVAVDPHGGYIVVQRVDDAGIHLFRVPLDGGKEEAMPLRGDLRLAPTAMQPGAVASDGRIAVSVVSPASWFWPAAILDPTTGKMELTPSGLAYDMGPSWAADGSIVSAASPLESHMWRLKPIGGRAWWK
jgi:eukaryotic-like serine/threonine-protein kinase